MVLSIFGKCLLHYTLRTPARALAIEFKLYRYCLCLGRSLGFSAE